ncbi:TPA: hypothetical protein LSX38_003738 [Escherichia coli]|nr:hypothetical protein [Escherichia coli]
MPEVTGSLEKGFEIKETISELVFNQEGLVIDHSVQVDGVTHRIVKYDNNGSVAIRYNTDTGSNFSLSLNNVKLKMTDNNDPKNTVTATFSRNDG